MAFSFLQRGNLAEYASQLELASFTPTLALEGLTPGVDNVRYDVYLSPKFCEIARLHVARLIAKHGRVEDLVANPGTATAFRPPSVMRPAGDHRLQLESGDFKRVLTELHLASLNRAKTEGSVSLDLLARLAIFKFLRAELGAQFAILLERCRARLKAAEGLRHVNSGKEIELRERAAAFHLAKKTVLRKTGQELFHSIREIEKETLLRMRRSLFAEGGGRGYDLFLNRLAFTENGRDDYINAEYYVMLGNFVNDPDRFEAILDIAAEFVRSLGITDDCDGLLSAPENAQELVAGGTPDDSPQGRMQKALLDRWLEVLDHAGIMDHVVACYEAAPLLAEYAAFINPQQIKNALISKAERARVLTLLHEQRKVSPDNLEAAVRRVAACRGGERAKVAGRFLRDLIRYNRDLRRLEALTLGMDSINLVASEKVRELSAINRTLYEYLLPEEQKPAEDKVVHHIIIKADIRDSTTLTRTLFERGLNPASYFSLNFYEPVNKLLPKYNASKVFIEGDAVILALFEREGDPELEVARACVLAREIISIVSAYNEASEKAGLPTLELGIGISYQDAAPMYLMDGDSRIMISKALNESDRLSSCSKSARRLLASTGSLFNVYSLQTIEEADSGGVPEEFLVRYNVGGIHISEAAFSKLAEEISLQEHLLTLPPLWPGEDCRFYSGLVPVGTGSFHRIIVRQGRVPHLDSRDFSLKRWTERPYFEVCTNPAIYEVIEQAAVAGIGD